MTKQLNNNNKPVRSWKRYKKIKQWWELEGTMGGGATLGRVTMDTHSDGVKTVKRLEEGRKQSHRHLAGTYSQGTRANCLRQELHVFEEAQGSQSC